MNKLSLILLICISGSAFAQNQDSLIIRKIFNEALLNGKSYQMLDYLSNKIGGRLSGSPEAAAAVEWSKKEMEKLGFDTVYLQECMVPHWVRGEKETASITSKGKNKPVPVCALGGSVGTPEKGITAEVIEAHGLEDLKNIGSKAAGKIVFFNKPLDATKILTFEAYGGAVGQRWAGPIEAAKLGAVGVIVRSMTTSLDDFPHTGTMQKYPEGVVKIPACAISTNGAEQLSRLLKEDPSLKFTYKMNCQTLPDAKSYNVIGEIRGTEKPEEIIVVGGHLDSWDTGDGAHDDGAGCVQSIEVLRLFKSCNLKPKRTIRAVMFMNEENGGRGGDKYAEEAKLKKENHIAAIESDAGGFSPRGFSMEASPEKRAKIKAWAPLFAPYEVYSFDRRGAGADVDALKDQGAVAMELLPDSQRYFDYHHTENDIFKNVNKRELELGAASMAALVYLISQYGL